MKKTEQELMEEDFKTAYSIIHQYMINVTIAITQGKDMIQQERSGHLLRVALTEYEEKIREELGFEEIEDED
jgi:hypothetical protein